MAQVHEFNIGNWNKLGTTTPVPRWQFTIQIKWTDNDGAAQEHSGTYTFPNVLSIVPDAIMKEWVQNMIQTIAFHELGIQSIESLRK